MTASRGLRRSDTKLGAKNWLFIGQSDAGERSTLIYSIIGSCRRQGIDPRLYLRGVIGGSPAMTNHDDFAALLPANWTPLLAAMAK